MYLHLYILRRGEGTVAQGAGAGGDAVAQAFFVLDLKITGGMFNYSIRPEDIEKAVLELFDAALESIRDLPKVP
jgi:hypothetical protein